jgi:hypothetical protein
MNLLKFDDLKSWIFVESLENWNEDKKNGFKYIGIDLKKLNKRKISAGDIFFTYISKEKKFSDCRIIVSAKSELTPNSFNYSKKYTNCIKTKIIKQLEQKNWLDFEGIKDLLEIFATSKSPQLKLLNAPTQINKFDRDQLIKLMKINN